MNVTSSTARILAEQQACGQKRQNPGKRVDAFNKRNLKARTLPQVNGFQASTKVSAKDYQLYYIELKRRDVEFDPDNIPENAEVNPDNHLETLIGEIEILVPKRLKDKNGGIDRRQIWDDYAIVCGYCLLYSVEAGSRGVNQLFIFSDKKALIKRAEFAAWDEGQGTKNLYVEEISSNSLRQAREVINVCLIHKMDWLINPSGVAA